MKEKPTYDDLGRRVVYTPLNMPPDYAERGVISDIGVGPYIFVRYNNEWASKATPFACLEFEEENER